MDDNARTTILKARLNDGSVVRIETSQIHGEEKVASKTFNFQEVATSIESIAGVMKASLDKVKPKKATIEFGVEIGAESGQLTALIVKGSGKANLKVTLEWS